MKHMLLSSLCLETLKPDATHAQRKAACRSKLKTGLVNDGVLTNKMKQAQS